MQTLDNKRVQQLLLQATMGFKNSDVKRVHDAGSLEAWIDEQTDHWRTSLVNRQNEMQKLHDKENWDNVHFNLGYTDLLLNRNDVLRHRVTYVLSQLFVVSNNAPSLTQSHRRIAFANYYDQLSAHCFTHFRELLKVMATSPVMGQYLTYLNNDHQEDVAPDENFARELMQLFTIGPALLKMDGSVIEDANNRPVLSYTQQDIEEGAKVLTGWGLHNDDWLKPMREKQDAHNLEAKVILGQSFPEGASAEQDLDQLLDVLCGHQNIAPFVAKFFIQKMVSSNPAPEYIERVANQFLNSGLDMVVLIKAILLDEEATYSRQDPSNGLVRDPLISLSHSLRALNVTLKPGKDILPNSFTWHDRRMIMEGPSVFYYYQPDEAPNDERFSGLAAPEFKIYNWDDVYHYFRQVSDLAVRLESENVDMYMNRNQIVRHFQETFNDEKLIEELDEHLFASAMSEPVKEVIQNYLIEVKDKRNNGNLRALLIQLLMSPEFMTQG
ncbi:DUF1800 family protein [Vibrio sp. FNV 38]|nr:DUF1800 family protein [Vibrio sp. FNV 38]